MGFIFDYKMKITILNLILKLFYKDTSVAWGIKYNGFKNKFSMVNKNVLIGNKTNLKARVLTLKDR